ncbi:MAG TPA: hypothetical protein PK504_00125 [Ferruginibacter sp.]|nr:hypothetical protein [Ferruginibacter sp.]HRE63349.1 hypothetical protein [Ferruginibacter sp.]
MERNKKVDEFKSLLLTQLINMPDIFGNKIRIKVIFPPYINKGYQTEQSTLDIDENIQVMDKAILFNYDLDIALFKLIYTVNQNDEFNTLVFETIKDNFENATIEISFNQEVEDTFRNNLPKSWRKKTIIPWWKNSDETKGLE